MIYLASVALNHYSPGLPPKPVLHSTSIALPTDRPMAVLAPTRSDRAAFLRLLAGVELPSHGRVTTKLRLSPVVKNGVLFHRGMSIADNFRFFARLLNADEDKLLVVINSFCEFHDDWHGLTKDDEAERIRYAEIAMLSLLCFDCYLVEDIPQCSELIRQRFFDAAAERKAGIIFSANNIHLVRRFAECAVVLRDGELHPFSNVEEAVQFHEQ